MTSPAIVLRNVTKTYPGYYHLTGGIKHFLFNLGDGIRQLKQRTLALEDISFEIETGDSFGIIGRNGAGKSTLLGLMAGVLKPNAGIIRVSERVSPMLELGSGFHHELTGRENIMLNGVLMGLKRSDIFEKMDEIIEFSELGDFIEQPIRTYSSGMVAKLGFSVIAHLDPRIMLIDEVLAVGDIKFQQKSLAKMEEFRRRPDVTFVLVSHAMATIRNACRRAAWIMDHKLHMIGPADEVTEAYEAYFSGAGKARKASVPPPPPPEEVEAFNMEHQTLSAEHKRLVLEHGRLAAERDALAARIERDEKNRIMRHAYPQDWVAPPAGFPEEAPPPTEEDAEFARRLARVLSGEQKRDSEQLLDRDDGIWPQLSKGHEELAALLIGGRFMDAAAYLDRMAHTSLTAGLAQGAATVEALKEDTDNGRFLAQCGFDRLLSLAEATGAVSLENPEQGDWGDLTRRRPDEILDLVYDRLNFKPQLPSFTGGLWGLHTGYGHLSPWDPQSIYLVHRIKELFSGDLPEKIGEISAGIGHDACQIIAAGCRDYTIFDWPTINVAQAWFLRRNHPNMPLVLSDEADPFSVRPGTRVLSTRHFSGIPDGFFDLVLNIDKLSSMSEQVALAYLSGLRGKTRYLLSISHEARTTRSSTELHGRVLSMVERVGGYRRLLRTPYWIRKGYVEELYEVK